MVKKLDNHYILVCELKDIVKDVFQFTRSFLCSPKNRHLASEKVKPKDFPPFYRQLRSVENKELNDLSREIDVKTEMFFLERLGMKLPAMGIEDFIVLTEERGVIYYSRNGNNYNKPIYILNIDPIDSTDLAISGLGGAVSVSVAFMKGKSAELVAAVVGDLMSREIYWAFNEINEAYIDFEEDLRSSRRTERIKPNVDIPWDEVKLSSFAAKINRFSKFTCKKDLISVLNENSARIILHSGGPIPIVKTACGDIDAVVEFIKGYKAIDYAGGLFIAEKAGTKIRFFDNNFNIENKNASQLNICEGSNLEDSLLNTLKYRQRFIVAANETIMNVILEHT